jgi:tetratricopeptide (TPR) repeat protein
MPAGAVSRRRARARAQAPHASPAGARWRAALIALVVFAAYAKNLDAPFIFDDKGSIEANLELRQWPDVGRIVRSASPESPFSGRPIVSLTFGLNYAMGALDVRGYRLVNVAIHAACALLLFGVVRRTLARAPAFAGTVGPIAANVALAAALVWAVHPLNTESVSYLTQRTELLMGFFAFLTLYASVRAHEPARRLWWQATAVGAAALGMLCKETMVVVPVLVVLYDRVFVFASWRDAVKARGWFYAAIAASWIALAAVVLSTPRTTAAGFRSTQVSAWDYLLNQTIIITRYLWLGVWPRSLVLFYGWAKPVTLVAVWPYAVFITGLAIVTVAAFRRHASLAYLGAWFFITLSPASSVVPIAGEVGAERRMYLPLAALAVLGTIAAVRGWRWIAARRPTPIAQPGRLGWAALAVVVVLLGTGTVLRSLEYDNPLTMARTVYDRWRSGAAANMVGTELVSAGRSDEAMPFLREAALDYPPGQFVLGVLLFKQGAYDEAVRELRAFVAAEPQLATACDAEMLIADALVRRQRSGEAAELLTRLAAASPRRLDALARLADLRFDEGAYPAAITAYETFLRTKPGQPEAMMNLAVAYASTGRLADAIGAFREVARLQPGNIEAALNLARALLDRGDPRDVDEALRIAGQGAAVSPAFPPVEELLGRALERKGDRAGARAAYERALAIDPSFAPARAGLARIRSR